MKKQWFLNLVQELHRRSLVAEHGGALAVSALIQFPFGLCFENIHTGFRCNCRGTVIAGLFSVTCPPLRCATIALLIVGHSVLSPCTVIRFVWRSNASEVEVTLARNVVGSTSIEVTPAQIARSSLWPSANTGTAFCIAPCARRVLLDALCLLDSTMLIEPSTSAAISSRALPVFIASHRFGDHNPGGVSLGSF